MLNLKIPLPKMASPKTLDDQLFDFAEAKEKELKIAEDELKQLGDEELSLQRQKQQLLSIQANLGGVFKLKEDKLKHYRGGLTQMQQNVFDQIYPIVSDIHYQELLVMELTQELQRHQIAKDVGYICSKITEESRLHLKKPNPLWNWYREMREYDQSYRENHNFNLTNEEIPDCHFFYPCYEEMDSKVQLTFSSRHRDMCVHLDISRDSMLRPEESCLTYRVTSDITMDSLELEANRSLLQHGYTARQFVEDIVWPCMDDLR